MGRKPRWLIEEQERRADSEKQSRRQGGSVATPDGPGRVLCWTRQVTRNNDEGVRLVRVRLTDGRIRHYAPWKIKKEKES